jgi:hypothetical protein
MTFNPTDASNKDIKGLNKVVNIEGYIRWSGSVKKLMHQLIKKENA